MTLQFKPTQDRVLIEPIYTGNEQVGSLVIPESHRDRSPTEGVVAAIGPKVDLMKIGHRIIFPRHEGTQVKIRDTVFKLFRQQEILAVIEN